jgi:transposase
VIHLEVGDFARFQRPGQLAAWLGLVPSLHQSGESDGCAHAAKPGNIAVVAAARELACFLWAAAMAD